MKRFFKILIPMSLFLILTSLCYAAQQAPQLTSNTAGLDITLSWTDVEDASGYTLFYAPYPSGSPVRSTDMQTLTSLSATLWKGAALFVAVQAYDESMSGDYSNVVTLITGGGVTAGGFTPADSSMGHLGFLAKCVGKRTAGSEQETVARDYITGQFEALGYTATTQEFEFERDETVVQSANVVVVKPGVSEKQIIVGAHYDSVGVGEGVSDNGSGVAVMLAAAAELAGKNLPYTIKFIAFGAEEVGLQGSQYFASQMTADDIAGTVCMLNLDTLAGGDKIYVYGGADQAGWVRDQFLQKAATMEIPLETNPGLNEEYPAGTTGDWSDHAPFKGLGIPFAYLESTNWEIGDLDGYMQTEKHGEIWHTENDTLAFYDAEFPGMVEGQLDSFIKVLNELLLTIEPPESVPAEARAKSVPVVNYKTRNGEAL